MLHAAQNCCARRRLFQINCTAGMFPAKEKRGEQTHPATLVLGVPRSSASAEDLGKSSPSSSEPSLGSLGVL